MVKSNSGLTCGLAAAGVMAVLPFTNLAQANERLASSAVAVQRAAPTRVARPIAPERPAGISAAEAKRLRHLNQDLKKMKRFAAADGEITRAEQKRIDNKTHTLRKAIEKAKSN
ncbi:MAG: hypothetical protein R3F58_14085 [Steroidobacteraceae bacterium]